MSYEFSWTSFFIGLIIMVVSGALLALYRPVADNFGAGAGDYDKYRLAGLIGCVFGFLYMFNLPIFLLKLIFSSFFPRP